MFLNPVVDEKKVESKYIIICSYIGNTQLAIHHYKFFKPGFQPPASTVPMQPMLFLKKLIVPRPPSLWFGIQIHVRIKTAFPRRVVHSRVDFTYHWGMSEAYFLILLCKIYISLNFPGGHNLSDPPPPPHTHTCMVISPKDHGTRQARNISAKACRMPRFNLSEVRRAFQTSQCLM